MTVTWICRPNLQSGRLGCASSQASMQESLEWFGRQGDFPQKAAVGASMATHAQLTLYLSNVNERREDRNSNSDVGSRIVLDRMVGQVGGLSRRFDGRLIRRSDGRLDRLLLGRRTAQSLNLLFEAFDTIFQLAMLVAQVVAAG